MKSILTGFLIFLATVSGASASTVVSAPTASGGPGQFSIAISVSGAADVYAYQFDLGFDPSLLSAVSVSEGSFLSPAGATFFVPGTIDNTAGVVSFVADTLLTATPGANGAGELAEITFTALRNGVSALSLSNIVLLDSSLSTIATTASDGAVTVTAGVASVPEPSSGALLALALSFVVLRRVSRRRSTPVPASAWNRRTASP